MTYVWADAEPTEPQRAVLDTLLSRVVRLGHSSSLVSARLIDESVDTTWRPDAEGEATLRVVAEGQLSALERAFERHQEVEPRVMPAVQQGYTATARHGEVPTASSVFSRDWLVLRRVSGPLFPMTSAVGLSRAVRRTLMLYAEEPISELLSGHALNGQPSERPHLAIVPVPFVGHLHASGAVLGIGLVFPRSAGLEDRRAVYTALARWEREHRQEDEDTPVLPLNLGEAGVLHLERVEWGSVQASLRSGVWAGPAAVWSSVTPIALDRNPGDLRSRDHRKLAEAVATASDVVGTACERIGLPHPNAVEILPAAPWAAAAKARRYPAFPGDPGRTQRVLTHARLMFDQPVSGPVLLGAGRYVGLGLFRPERGQ